MFDSKGLTSDSTSILGQTDNHPFLGLLTDSVAESCPQSLLEEGQEFGHTSVHTDIDRLRPLEGLSVQDHGSDGTSRKGSRPRRCGPASPLNELDILVGDIALGDVQLAEDDRFGLLSVLDSLDGRNKGGVESVVRVEDGAGLTVEEEEVVDQVKQNVSYNLAEVLGTDII